MTKGICFFFNIFLNFRNSFFFHKYEITKIVPIFVNNEKQLFLSADKGGSIAFWNGKTDNSMIRLYKVRNTSCNDLAVISEMDSMFITAHCDGGARLFSTERSDYIRLFVNDYSVQKVFYKINFF